MTTETRPHRSLRPQSGSSLIGILVAIFFVVTLTALLYFRVAISADRISKSPLPVATANFQVQEGYARTVSYLGLIVAGRKADLGFELPGMIASPPPRPGTPVKQGGVLVTLDNSALHSRRKSTAANLQQARVELELAQLKARRQENLIKTGAVSKDVYDETRLRALALESRVEAESARLGDIDIELEKSRLLAPYDGIVAERYVQQGAIVNPGVPVVRLLESAQQESHIGVSAERAGELMVGNAYTLKLRDNTFDAELLTIRPDVDPITRTATAVFSIPAQIEALDGEPVTLELQEPVSESGGWLPIASLLEGSRGVWTVLKLEPEGEYLRTVTEAVEVLAIDGDRAFVRGTLTTGSQVVASGMHRITPGVLVTAASAD
jgi:membrane fusion protein, multidrug efflux system